jgi:hypothetical protein
MPVIVRNSGPRGPRFYAVDRELMFVNVIDGSTCHGPRPATAEDKAEHPDAYARFKAGTPDEIPGAKPIVTFKGERPADEEPRRARGSVAPG